MKKPTVLFVLPYGFNDRMMNFPEFVVGRWLAKKGWHILGMARPESDDPPSHKVRGIDVQRYGSFYGGALHTFLTIAKDRPDIVHVHTLRNNRIGVIAAMFAKIFGIPLAFTEAGLLHDHFLTEDRDDPLGKPIRYQNVIVSLRILFRASIKTPSRFLYFFHSYVYHWPLTHADALVFFSKHNVAIAEKIGAPDAQYIPVVVDEFRWVSAKQSEISTADIEKKLPSTPYALFVGQMKERKGWDILLRAIPLVERNVVDTFVIVSSTGHETDAYTKLIEELNIRDRILFLGTIADNAGLRKVFEKSALVVVPSRYEGFGLVPLDAFDVGKPVVASRVEALTDFLTHEKNAYLVPPKDPAALAKGITTVANDVSLRETIITGGRATLAEFKSEKYFERWLKFYSSLIETPQ